MLQNFPALGDILLAVLFLEPTLDFRPCSLGMYQTQVWIKPVTAWTTLFGCQDLDLLAGIEDGVKRDEFVIDFGTPATVTYGGVDMIGKVDRRRTSR